MINLNDALKSISKDNNWDDIMVCSKIIDIWAEILGANLANVATVRKFEDGTLFLKARSSTWKSEINLRNEELIKQINDALKQKHVKRLVVKS